MDQTPEIIEAEIVGADVQHYFQRAQRSILLGLVEATDIGRNKAKDMKDRDLIQWQDNLANTVIKMG